jgi:hypothetical protein
MQLTEGCWGLIRFVENRSQALAAHVRLCQTSGSTPFGGHLRQRLVVDQGVTLHICCCKTTAKLLCRAD